MWLLCSRVCSLPRALLPWQHLEQVSEAVDDFTVGEAGKRNSRSGTAQAAASSTPHGSQGGPGRLTQASPVGPSRFCCPAARG